MKDNIMEALKPGLEPMPGDRVVLAGKVGGTGTSIIIWQGFKRDLSSWALAMGRSRSSLRHRLSIMDLKYAMDRTYTITKAPGYKQPPKKDQKPEYEPRQGIDYTYIPPVKALLPLEK